MRAGADGAALASPTVAEMLARAALDATRPEGLASSTACRQNGYLLSEAQAQAILELRLQRLTGLERDKIVADYAELLERIADLMDILARPERITEMIVDELTGDPRPVRRQAALGDRHQHAGSGIEDFITPVDMVVTLSHTGYIKSQPLADYRAQRRGGRGKQAAAMKTDDFVDHLFVANTHDFILCFTNRGRVYWLKVYEVPQGTRTAAASRSSTSFPSRRARRSAPSCRSRSSPTTATSSCARRRGRSRRRRCRISRTRARPASSPSRSTRTMS
jgi:DNA gyrase subunit A